MALLVEGSCREVGSLLPTRTTAATREVRLEMGRRPAVETQSAGAVSAMNMRRRRARRSAREQPGAVRGGSRARTKHASAWEGSRTRGVEEHLEQRTLTLCL